MYTWFKKLLHTKTMRVIWISYALFSVVLVLYLSNRLICKDYDTTSDKLVLNDGWNISLNDTNYTDVSIDSFQFPIVNKGDTIVMETTLPSDWKYEETALCIHIRHTTLEVYVDDTLIHEYGHERVEQNKAVGSGYQLMNFSNEYKGKELKIVMEVTENRAFTSFDSIWINEWQNTYRLLMTENRLPMLFGCFLVVMGILVTLVSIFALALSKKHAGILCLSLFSICMGIWTLCYYNVVIIFSIPLYSISLMEYMSLFLAPLPIIGYMYSYVKQLQNRRIMLTYKILFALQIILTIVAISLHTTDTIHGAALLPNFQFLFAIHAFFFTYVLRKSIRNNYVNRRFYSFGLLAIVVCIVYELLSYCFTRYLGLNIFNLKGISSLGIILFIAILILDLYYDATRKMMEEQEKALLIKRAYTDDLTQIHNRAFCSEYMNKIEHENITEYAIVNFDLNGLKKANDTYGHTHGDFLIQTAAKVISDAFSASGIVGRMGGDEFIAILKTCDAQKIEPLLSSFTDLIAQTNQKEKNLNLSISYGYATSKDLPGENVEKVYQLADNRMYAYKKQYKKMIQQGAL